MSLFSLEGRVTARPRVEVMTFSGCPNAEPALALVERVTAELEIDAEVEKVEVETVEKALDMRFLGSPSIRVNGRDVEPGADDRIDFALSCRVYSTETGLQGQPDESWLREALTNASRRPE